MVYAKAGEFFGAYARMVDRKEDNELAQLAEETCAYHNVPSPLPAFSGSGQILFSDPAKSISIIFIRINIHSNPL